MKLTSNDPEPAVGQTVVDALGTEWVRWVGPYGDTYWVHAADPVGSEPESWQKVAGNYGPVSWIELTR